MVVKPNETALERIASSSKTDGWAALIACVVIVAQVVGLVLGVDLLRSIPVEFVIGLFGVTAYTRRKLANGRGVRERSVEDLPIPKAIADLGTAPIEFNVDNIKTITAEDAASVARRLRNGDEAE